MPTLAISRSSHQRCSMKKGVLRNFTKFTGKHLCRSLFFTEHLWTTASEFPRMSSELRKTNPLQLTKLCQKSTMEALELIR